MLHITYFGHSGFLISSGSHAVAIDPFLTGNPVAKHKAADVKCDAICLTHGHMDHFGDTVSIADRNSAAVYAAFELGNVCEAKGVKHVEHMNPGGRVAAPFGWVALTHAFHSSSDDENGTYTGMPCGVMLNIGGVTIYHCGDTGIFSDMKLFGELYKPDIAMIPIGDRFTMGPEHASMATEFIRPKVAIPIHYNTWPPIQQDPTKFKPKGVEVKILNPGESFDYP